MARIKDYRGLETERERQLLAEIEVLRAQLDEAEGTLCAIRGGEVDAFVVHGPGGDTVYTLGMSELLNQLRLITDVLPVLISYVDHEGRLQFTNRQYEMWFQRDDFQGRHLREIFGEAGYEALLGQAEAALEGRKGTSCAWVKIDPVGERCLQATFVPHVHQGEVQGFVSLIEDITERRRAEEALREDIQARRQTEADLLRAKEAAETANRAKDQFLATLSHELRTPLTPVLAVASMWQRDHRLPADVQQGLAVIRRNIELEARLIDDLLDLTRIARGKLDLQVREARLDEIVAAALETCNSQEIEEKGLRIDADLLKMGFPLRADPARLTQVFWNLLRNAIKFSMTGGSIEVRPEVREGWLEVKVIDSGIGIEPALLEQIFTAFDQGRPETTREFGGLGLGLAISRAIVELHGGHLQAASGGIGRGATFTVTLPLAEGARPAVESPQDETPSLASRGAGRGLRILLVEDHSDTAEAMAFLLAAAGHEVEVANTAAEARQKAADRAQGGGRPYDLVVSDLGLPDASGLELMKDLSERHQLKGLALSGYGMEDDVKRSLEAGFRRHLTKPVSPEVLIQVVRDLGEEVGRG